MEENCGEGQGLIWTVEPRRQRERYGLHLNGVHQYLVFCFYEVTVKVLPCLRWLVVGVSPRIPKCYSGSVHVGLVVDKVALGQVCL
jgi:hypothetical protein